MSTSMQEKQQAHRDAWVRNEAMKIVKAKEAQAVADLVKPDMEAKFKEWIREEVDKQLTKQLERLVKEEVALYCKSVFDGGQQEDYMTVKVEEVESDEKPYDDKLEFEEL
jgi:5-formyltetrahydrofolate cyclo-ligase